MSEAVRVILGPFGRVALVDLAHGLVRHAHPHCHMLFKVAGADTSFVVGNEPMPLTDETFLMVDAWQPHAFMHSPGQPNTQIIALYIEPEWLASYRPDWLSSGDGRFFNRSCGQVTDEMRRLLRTLAECLKSNSDSVADTEWLLGVLVVSVIARYSDWGSSTFKPSGSHVYDWRIRKAIGHIRGSSGDGLSIETMIDDAGMSRSNFFRRFKACTGMSPGLFQNVVRLEQAVQLTIKSQEPLSSTASRLGFIDQAHFSRFFRNHTAVSPRQYRQGATEWPEQK